jgi:hypothetical protein
MVAAFDDIDRRFIEIEVYLQAFDGDESILATSTDLIAAVLQAVELVLDFFVSRTCEFASSDFGDGHQADLSSDSAH